MHTAKKHEWVSLMDKLLSSRGLGSIGYGIPGRSVNDYIVSTVAA